MAILRQAKPDAGTIDLYAAKLLGYSPRDVSEACSILADAERAEGETAFPSLAAVQRAVVAVRDHRVATSEAEMQRRLVAWRCRSCKGTMSGFLRPGDDTFRTCQRSIGRDEQQRSVSCGEALQVVLDDRRSNART